jgi:agarase
MAQEPPVSEEGRQMLALHQEFVGLTRKYPSDIHKHINFGDERLYWLKFLRAPLQVNGEASIEIPGDLVKHWGRCRQLRVTGEGVDSMKIILLRPDGSKKPFPDWWYSGREKSRYMASLIHWHEGALSGYSMLFSGKGVVKDLAIGDVNGVPLTFDFLPYSSVGVDKPVLKGEISLDTTRLRFINGVNIFDSTKNYRLYCAPTAGVKGKGAAEMAQAYFMGRNFLPGRQIYGLSKFEDPTWKDRFIAANADEQAKALFLMRFPPSFEYATCFDNWPQRVCIKKRIPGNANIRGTPDESLFEEAAKIASEAVSLNKAVTGRTATYWEVKNESDVGNEWAYHDDPSVDGWKLLADFHNVVADRLHKDHPGVKVGGPTACTVNFGGDDCKPAQRLFKFFDRTRTHLDFYSFHYYGSHHLLRPRRSDFLLDGISANTDLMMNYLTITSNVKPIVVSESGSDGGHDAFTHFQQLHIECGVMGFFVNHPDIFAMTTLFTIPVTWWAKDSKCSLFVYRPDGLFDMSPQCLLLELWKDHVGRPIPVKASFRDVSLHAVMEGDSISVAATNMLPQRYELDIRTALPVGVKVLSVERRRLYLDMGNLHYETEKVTDPGKVAFAGLETSMFSIRLSARPVPESAIEERTFYGDKVLLRSRIGEKIPAIKIACDRLDALSSSLRIGYRPDKGKNPLKVSINGKPLQTVLLDSYDDGFAQVVIDVPPSILKASNSIELGVPTGAAVGAAVLANEYPEMAK